MAEEKTPSARTEVAAPVDAEPDAQSNATGGTADDGGGEQKRQANAQTLLSPALTTVRPTLNLTCHHV